MIEERGDYYVFHTFYRELVQALYNTGAQFSVHPVELVVPPRYFLHPLTGPVSQPSPGNSVIFTPWTSPR
jgi:hypothetical protein